LQAGRLYKRALKINEKSLGLNHPTVAVSLNSLAALYRDIRRPEEAERLEKRASEILAMHQ
jgi:hypothetical protein